MGILSVWVSSFMINKTLMIGGQEAKNVMIISNKHKEIMEYIHKELNRGTTLLQAVGDILRKTSSYYGCYCEETAS